MPNYSACLDCLIKPAARNLADHASTVVCPRLKISKPALNWFYETRFGAEWFENGVLGWCSKDGRTIFIRHDCSPFQIANTVVHECRHCWQIQHPRWFPVPNKTYTRGLTQSQKERDARIFECEFWNGREKQDGSFADITEILTEMQIERARAELQARSQQYGLKPRIIGLPYASSGSYPSQVKMRLIVPTDREMEESLLRHILNG